MLLFVNTHSVLADNATFSASSSVGIRVRPTVGITVDFKGSAALPTPTPVQEGSGVVTKFPPATQEFPEPLSVRLTFREIAGHAGPGPGLARVTQSGTSSQLILTNDTNRVITVSLDYNLTSLLMTSVTGSAVAEAQFEFSIVRDGSTIFSDHFASPGMEFPLSRGGTITFDLPAFGSTTIILRGSQSGLAAVPEPTTMLLLGTGLAGVAIKIRKRLKNN